MLPQRGAQTFVYERGNEATRFELVTRTGPGEIAVWLPPQFSRPYLVLGQTRAASGARYEGDGVLLWTHGAEALLEVDGVRQKPCRENRRRSIWEHAKLSGVDFRAVGNEPGWTLELREGRQMRFIYDYGQSEVTTPCPDPVTDLAARRTVYATTDDEHQLTVTLSGEPCADTMSGEQFSTTVMVSLDGRMFHGCGRPLH